MNTQWPALPARSQHRVSRRLVGAGRLLLFVAALIAAVLTPSWLLAQSETSASSDNPGQRTAELEQFITRLDQFEARFEQTVYDADSEPLRVSTGSVQMKRPARVRWRYDAPESQLIVADGRYIWLYDQDLEQVTVNPVDQQLQGTPLQLLMRSAPLDEGFEVDVLGEADGITWYGLIPRTQASDFEQVYIGLQNNDLVALELRDSFGQATQIIFSDFQQDSVLDDSLFRFDVPPGVDVIGEVP